MRGEVCSEQKDIKKDCKKVQTAKDLKTLLFYNLFSLDFIKKVGNRNFDFLPVCIYYNLSTTQNQ